MSVETASARAEFPSRRNPNIGRLFDCQTVAIVGASTSNIYAMGLINRVQGGANTRLIGVNPNRTEVAGIPCVHSISELPLGVDAAFVAIGASQVPEVLLECHAAGIDAAVVVAAGFGESQLESDRDRQRELAEIGASTGMAICGPSCLGIANVVDGHYIFGSTASGPIAKGRIGLISQSGGTVSALVRAATRRRLGFSHLVSCGTEASLDACDYLEFLLADERTDVICLFLERLSDSERFIHLARTAAELGKALFCIKIGRSAQGARAAIGHTGALTGSDSFYEALFAETGVRRAWAVEQMMDEVSLLAQSDRSHWPTGNRVGIVTVSGGTGTILADLCSVHGLAVPALDAADTEALSERFPGRIRVENPIDVSAQLQRERPEAWSGSVRTLAEAEAIDVVLVADLHPQSSDRITILDDVRAATGTPVALTPVSDGFDLLDEAAREQAQSRRLPVLGGGESAVRALGAATKIEAGRTRLLARGGAWVAGTPTTSAPPSLTAPEATRNEVMLRSRLAAAGLMIPHEELFADAAALAAGIERFSFPVAVKVCDARVVHKAAAGMMVLGAGDPGSATAAAEDLWGRFASRFDGEAPEGVLVQEMVAAGVYELYVSTLRESDGRPLVTVGQGGSAVEVAREVVRRLAPVSRSEAQAMLGELGSFSLLRNVDVTAAAQAVALISDCALWLGRDVTLLEFNPLIVMEDGAGVFAVDTVIDCRRPGEEDTHG
jgi:acetate---CoA ligase (ADP-forming)